MTTYPKPYLTIIAAVAHGGAIGIGGDMPFHISADLRRFKAFTMGHPLIMGRKTFESFPAGPLPGRRNIVITRNPDYKADGIEKALSLSDAIAMVSGCEKAFIIGGGQIYAQAMEMADELDLTEIDSDVVGADTFFPAFDSGQWQEIEASPYQTDPRSGAKFRFTCRKRK